MNEHKATVTHLTPAMGQILVGGATTRFPSLRRAFFVGDPLTKQDCRKLCDLAPNTRVVNLFGSTESQRVSLFEIMSKKGDPDSLSLLPGITSVGQRMLNVQLLVVDFRDRTRLCDLDETGELFIRAAGLADGYRGDDERTMELDRYLCLTGFFILPGRLESLNPKPPPMVITKGHEIVCTGLVIWVACARMEVSSIRVRLTRKLKFEVSG